MARMARVVIPNYPHHVTQRGNRRQQTFFSQADYQYYLELLATALEQVDAEIWAYCLMPNHVHFVVAPETRDSLAQLFGEVHRRYTRSINFREGWRGHLWQERFHSFVMDEHYLFATVRYTELNPVRAGLCKSPQDWKWSSIHAHINASDDRIVKVKPMLDRIKDWREYLSVKQNPQDIDTIRLHTRTGRPIQSKRFLKELQDKTGINFRKGKPGPKKKN